MGAGYDFLEKEGERISQCFVNPTTWFPEPPSAHPPPQPNPLRKIMTSNLHLTASSSFRRPSVCGRAGGPRRGRWGAGGAGVPRGQQPAPTVLLDKERSPLCGKQLYTVDVVSVEDSEEQSRCRPCSPLLPKNIT
jgi:hypothetical protein